MYYTYHACNFNIIEAVAFGIAIGMVICGLIVVIYIIVFRAKSRQQRDVINVAKNNHEFEQPRKCAQIIAIDDTNIDYNNADTQKQQGELQDEIIQFPVEGEDINNDIDDQHGNEISNSNSESALELMYDNNTPLDNSSQVVKFQRISSKSPKYSKRRKGTKRTSTGETIIKSADESL